MKDLRDYILESVEEVSIDEAAASKVFTFDFTDLEQAEDTLKSFEEREGCEIEGQKLTVKLTAKNIDKMDSVQDILQQYAETLRKSTKNSSDEQYAQKTSAFAKKVGEFNDGIDEIENAEKNEQGDEEKVENPDEDKKAKEVK